MSKQNYKNNRQSNVSGSSTTSVDTERSYRVEEQNKQQSKQEQYMPSYHDIEFLAYRIHEDKGGTDLDNWLEAERTLKEKNCAGGC